LAACESGRVGVRRLEEEFVGLPGAFLHAGAACVVGSLWPVFDDAAYLLSCKFYELHLAPDGTERFAPAASLKAAQAWLRTATTAELRAALTERDSRRSAAHFLGETLRFNATQGDVSSVPITGSACPFAGPHEWAGFVVFGA